MNTQDWLENNTDRLPAWVCWPWKGERQDIVVARRAAYEASTGPVTSGLRVQVTCRGTDCVNPAHVVLVARTGAVNPAGLSEALQGALEHYAHLEHFRVNATALKARAGLKPLEQRQAFRRVAEELGLVHRHTSMGEFYYRGDWDKTEWR